LADYLTKQWALEYLPGKEINIIGEFFKLQLTYNTGAAFGLGANGAGALLALFAIGASCLVVYYAPFLTSRAWAIAFAMVLGGAIGNLTDRAFNYPGLFRGPVTDWLKLPNWPNFNLADTAIVLAAVMAFILTARNISPIEKGNSDINSDGNSSGNRYA
jgi:signal peptidase II